MIDGISHMTFMVSDLERSSRFFEYIFGARVFYESGENTFSVSRERFLDINGLWIVIMEGEPLNGRSYNHIAFQIRDEDFELYEGRLKEIGAEIRPSRPRVTEEGRSLYFYDYDNHLFELHAGDLQQRMTRYRQGK